MARRDPCAAPFPFVAMILAGIVMAALSVICAVISATLCIVDMAKGFKAEGLYVGITTGMFVSSWLWGLFAILFLLSGCE